MWRSDDAEKSPNTLWYLIFGFRMAGRRIFLEPGFAALVTLVLALGIGGTCAVFSVINGVLLAPLPFTAPERTVLINEVIEDIPNPIPLSPAEVLELKAKSQSLEYLAAVDRVTFNLVGGEEPERVQGALVSGNFFELLGTQPLHGRLFSPQEAAGGGEPVVVLNHGVWKRLFGGDPGLVGQVVKLTQATISGFDRRLPETFTVIGILPPNFELPQTLAPPDLWLPREPDPTNSAMDRHTLSALARLRPGVSIEQATGELEVLLRQVQPELQLHGERTRTVILSAFPELFTGNLHQSLGLLLAAAGFVLLLCCTNVGSLYLARGAKREREVAMRMAVGSKKRWLLCSILPENLVLSVGGGVLGLWAASLGVRALLAENPVGLPRLAAVGVDLKVLFVAIVLIGVISILFGLAPLWQARRINLVEALKAGCRASTVGRLKIRKAIMIVEVGTAVVLLSGAALMVRSALQMRDADVGFHRDHIATLSISLPQSKYPERFQQEQLHRTILEQVRALPAVTSAAGVNLLPFGGGDAKTLLKLEGYDPGAGERPLASYRLISEDYFQTLEVPVLQGRVPEAHEVLENPLVAVVNEALVQQYWPDGRALDRQVEMVGFGWAPMRVVGVVQDFRDRSITDPPTPTIFVPCMSRFTMRTVARFTGDSGPVKQSFRAIVAGLDPTQPVGQLWTLDEAAGMLVARERFLTYLLIVFAVVALLLALVGTYGVVSYAATQRTREMGIRSALGALGRDNLRLLMWQSFTPALAGVGVGVVLSLGLNRLLKTYLFEVSAHDPVALTASALILAVVALAGSFLPALRVSRVDPACVLREE